MAVWLVPLTLEDGDAVPRRRQRGFNKARVDDRYVHAGALQVQAQALEKRRQPGFAPTISGGFRQPAVTRQARDSDHLPLAPLDHLRQHGADGIDRPDQIYVDDLRGLCDIQIARIGRTADPSVGDHNIDMPELRAKFIRGFFYRFGRRHIRGKNTRRTSQLGASLRKLIQYIFAPRQQTQSRAALGHFNGEAFVNPDDLSDFITCFFLEVQFPSVCAAAYFNTDEFVNPDDLSDFITAFFLGC